MNDGAKALYGALIGAGGSSGGGGSTPTGTLNITANGTYDVTEYASVVVNVVPTQVTLTYDFNGGYYWEYDYEAMEFKTVGTSKSITKYSFQEFADSYGNMPAVDPESGDATNGVALNGNDDPNLADYPDGNTQLLGYATTSDASVPNVTFPLTISENTTIYAVWEANM